MLKLFAHAYRGIVVLTESKNNPSVTRIVRYRTGVNEENATVNAAVIDEVVTKQAAILTEDSRVVCVPLVDGDDRSLGVIFLEEQDTPGRFGTDDLDILATVAVEISFAVENSILHEAALRERALQLE